MVFVVKKHQPGVLFGLTPVFSETSGFGKSLRGFSDGVFHQFSYISLHQSSKNVINTPKALRFQRNAPLGVACCKHESVTKPATVLYGLKTWTRRPKRDQTHERATTGKLYDQDSDSHDQRVKHHDQAVKHAPKTRPCKNQKLYDQENKLYDQGTRFP